MSAIELVQEEATTFVSLMNYVKKNFRGLNVKTETINFDRVVQVAPAMTSITLVTEGRKTITLVSHLIESIVRRNKVYILQLTNGKSVEII